MKKCEMCDDYGYKDYAAYCLEPCLHLNVGKTYVNGYGAIIKIGKKDDKDNYYSDEVFPDRYNMSGFFLSFLKKDPKYNLIKEAYKK